MSQYYFLISSLPFLLPSGPADVSEDDFLGTCKSNMTGDEYNILTRCLLDPVDPDDDAVSHPVLSEWRSWETSLRNELVRLRASALKMDPEDYIQEGAGVAGLFEAAREAVNMSNPQEAEYRLDRLRWSFLDEIEAGHFFDLEKLLIYYLKLQILKRHEAFDPRLGDEAYRKVYESVVTQIQGD